MRANTYSPEWFSTFLRNMSSEQTEREAEFVDRQLGPASLVLDIPCGAGRHARALTQKGHQLVAVDRDASLLGSQTSPSLIWAAADMRRLPLRHEAVDAVVCLWQSFGYFSPHENAAVLREWARVTRPGGRLVLDLYDPSYFADHQGEREFDHPSGSIRETRTIRGNRLLVELVYEWSGREDRFDWQLFSPGELEAFASDCGWQLTASYSNFDCVRVPDGSAARIQHLLIRSAA